MRGERSCQAAVDQPSHLSREPSRRHTCCDSDECCSTCRNFPCDSRDRAARARHRCHSRPPRRALGVGGAAATGRRAPGVLRAVPRPVRRPWRQPCRARSRARSADRVRAFASRSLTRRPAVRASRYSRDAQSLDMWRELPLALTQHTLDSDLVAPAHVGQQAHDEQPDRQEQQRIKVAFVDRCDRPQT